jgi:hypothetical protein
MKIRNRVLTLTPNVANDTWECVAGCRVELTPFEIAGLAIPGNPGYTLRCFLEAVDVGPDTPIFTFPKTRTFKSLVDILDADDLFKADVSSDILDEDSNGADEIRAVFVLRNNSTGNTVRQKSGTHQIVA